MKGFFFAQAPPEDREERGMPSPEAIAVEVTSNPPGIYLIS